MGKDSKRRRKVLTKGVRTLRKRSNQHIAKAYKMRKTPESRSYALKEAMQFKKQAKIKALKVKTLRKGRLKIKN